MQVNEVVGQASLKGGIQVEQATQPCRDPGGCSWGRGPQRQKLGPPGSQVAGEVGEMGDSSSERAGKVSPAMGGQVTWTLGRLCLAMGSRQGSSERSHDVI